MKKCNRNGCNNMICNRYSTRYGHICPECFEELAKNGCKHISNFMQSKKKKPINEEKQETWEKYLDGIFYY